MKDIITTTKIIILSLIVVLGASYVYAWTGPTQSPPGGNTDAPINVSASSQYKAGALGVGGMLRGYANAIFDGKVGIGTVNPGAKLHIAAPGVPLLFEETDQSGAGSLWRMPLDSKILRFDSSDDGVDFTPYTTALAMTSDGNVGIGTLNPTAPLHISNGDNTVKIGSGNKTLEGGNSAGNMHIDSDDKLYLNYYAPGDVSIVQGGGNVGIGTGNPSVKLEIVGGATKTTGGFIMETRTSDPASPVAGQMWFRTDI